MPIPVYVYLSRDGQSRMVGRNELPALRPGQTMSETLDAAVPRDMAPGIYDVSIRIDPRNRVDEYSEENNMAAASQRLLVRGQ
jgi:subtilase family serine protease